MTVSLLIMAGGRATRLGGVHKPLVQVGGRTIVERIMGALGPLADECLALVQDEALPSIEGLRLVVDPRPHAGPLAALAHGLTEALGEVCMIVAGDMPFVSRAAFEFPLRQQAQVVVPFVDGHIESMHAVVARQPVLEALLAAQEAGEQRLFKVFQTLEPRLVSADELRTLDPTLLTLFNVNSPADLARAEAISQSAEYADGHGAL